MNPVETQIVGVAVETIEAAAGDFASGLRTQVARTRHPGDFAAGLRTTVNPMVVEDFATGMRSRPVFDRQLGDFATGQQSPHAVAAGTTTRRPRWHTANPLAQPGRP
jgi:hypothetical protein